MVAKAVGRFLPVAPRKVRGVTRLIKGMEVPKAQALLAHLPKAARLPVGKVLQSAVANATREGTYTPEQLVISRILADEGPRHKRFRAVAMGRATEYRKRTCHLTIELDLKASLKKVKGDGA